MADADDEIIQRISALVRSDPPPDERVLLRVIAILEKGRGEGSTGLGRSRQDEDRDLRRALAGLAGLGGSSGASDSTSRARSRPGSQQDRQQFRKSKLQPSVARPEHLTLNIGGSLDGARQKKAANAAGSGAAGDGAAGAASRVAAGHATADERGERTKVAPVNERALAVRRLQLQMESAPHADLLVDDATQIGGVIVKRKSMTHEFASRPGALTEMAGMLGGSQHAKSDLKVYEGALGHRPMRF